MTAAIERRLYDALSRVPLEGRLTPGAKLPDMTMQHCPTCGAPIDADAYWCEKCGTRVSTRVRESDPEPVAA